MVNDIIKELLGPDTEPKPASLWWTSTNMKYDNSSNVKQRQGSGSSLS